MIKTLEFQIDNEKIIIKEYCDKDSKCPNNYFGSYLGYKYFFVNGDDKKYIFLLWTNDEKKYYYIK